MRKSDFQRKTGKLAIVGFSPTTRHMAPWDNPEYEIWIVNEEYNMNWCKRFDRVFQMHQKWDFMRENNANDPNHPYWLTLKSGVCKQCDGTKEFIPIGKNQKIPCTVCDDKGIYHPSRNPKLPIYMQHKYKDVPGSIAFPLNETSEMIGRRYFRSSFAFMIALGIMMGFPKIEVYGFEMGTDTEYHYQKANGEFWIGFAQGKGIEVYLPDICTLLSGNVYGYEESRIGYRQNLETRKSVLDAQIKKQKSIMEQAGASAETVKQLLLHPEWKLEDILKKMTDNYQKARDLYEFVRGAKTETENLTRMHDKYFVGPSEKEDPIQYNYKITEENVKVEYAQE